MVILKIFPTCMHRRCSCCQILLLVLIDLALQLEGVLGFEKWLNGMYCLRHFLLVPFSNITAIILSFQGIAWFISVLEKFNIVFSILI